MRGIYPFGKGVGAVSRRHIIAGLLIYTVDGRGAVIARCRLEDGLRAD